MRTGIKAISVIFCLSRVVLAVSYGLLCTSIQTSNSRKSANTAWTYTRPERRLRIAIPNSHALKIRHLLQCRLRHLSHLFSWRVPGRFPHENPSDWAQHSPVHALVHRYPMRSHSLFLCSLLHYAVYLKVDLGVAASAIHGLARATINHDSCRARRSQCAVLTALDTHYYAGFEWIC